MSKKEKDSINLEDENTETSAEDTEISDDSQKPDTSCEEHKADEKSPLEKAEESIANLSDRLMRTAAEFDNYKKRSLREKDEIYGNAVCDTASALLPVLDNLARAVSSAEENGNENTDSMLDGIKMILKQFEDALTSIGVTPIEAVGEQFDPEKHNAVMTEDSDRDENTVLEEFMKGYIYKDEKIVRHSMVKVSN